MADSDAVTKGKRERTGTPPPTPVSPLDECRIRDDASPRERASESEDREELSYLSVLSRTSRGDEPPRDDPNQDNKEKAGRRMGVFGGERVWAIDDDDLRTPRSSVSLKTARSPRQLRTPPISI